MDRIADIALAIVTVAGITTIVRSSQSARIVGAVGDAFTGSLRAALGR